VGHRELARRRGARRTERWTGSFYELAWGRGPAPKLAGSDSRRVRVWADTAAGPTPGPRHPAVSFPIDNVPGLDFSPDGARVATNVLPRAELWDAATGTRLRSIPHTHSKHHGPVKFSPDGTRLAAGYRNVVTIYPHPEGAEPVTCKGHTDAVWAACWSGDGRTLLSASADGTCREWDPTSGAELRSFGWGIGGIHAVAFSADGLLGAAAGAGGKVVVWDVDA
jgi:WD40 repeat protein